MFARLTPVSQPHRSHILPGRGRAAVSRRADYLCRWARDFPTITLPPRSYNRAPTRGKRGFRCCSTRTGSSCSGDFVVMAPKAATRCVLLPAESASGRKGAVDDERLPRGERCFVGCQPGGEPSDFVGLTQSLKWLFAGE